jgi:uncharacterized membrane protein
VLLGAQNESVDLGVYIGFFLLDTLSALIITAGLFKGVSISKTPEKKKPKFANEKERRIAIITENAQARLANNRAKSN